MLELWGRIMKNIFDEKHAQFLQSFYSFKQKQFEKFSLSEKPALEMEAPFNYYGERGSVDLAVYWKPKTYIHHWKNLKDESKNEDWIYTGNKFILYELKTEIVNLGETIRQVKKAHEFFAKSVTHVGETKIDDTYSPSAREHLFSVDSYLILLDTEQNIDFLMKNRLMFEGAGFIGKEQILPTQLVVNISNGENQHSAPFARACDNFIVKSTLSSKKEM